MTETTSAMSRVLIKGDIQDVWREITKTGEAQKCMFNMVLHTSGLRPGATIQMRTISNKYVGIVGEVLEIDPPHKYSHTFKFTQHDDPWCKVTYLLEEVAGGVEFTLLAEDIPVGTKTAKEMVPGADMIVNTLKAVVENGRPGLGMRLLHVIFRLTEPLSPARTRVDAWS
jgi:uncharacterized protein YndB with AHSA1/START domain